MKGFFMILLTLFTFALVGFLAWYWFQKIDVSLSKSNVPMFALIANVAVIVLMLVTIIISTLSSEKMIKTLKNEVSKQITSYQQTSSKHIVAIERSTASQIEEMRSLGLREREVSLLTLSKELELNRKRILLDLTHKKDYLEGKSFNPTPLQTVAYDQGLITNILIDSKLMEVIFSVYLDFFAANKYIEMTIDTNTIPISNKKEIIKEYNKHIIDIYEKRQDDLSAIIEELKHIKIS